MFASLIFNEYSLSKEWRKNSAKNGGNTVRDRIFPVQITYQITITRTCGKSGMASTIARMQVWRVKDVKNRLGFNEVI